MRVRNESIETDVTVELCGHGVQGTWQQNAVRRCAWSFDGDAVLHLNAIEVKDYKEVVAHGPYGTWFTDCTMAVLGDNPAVYRQLRFGWDYWLQRIEKVHFIDNYKAYGLAVGDAAARRRQSRWQHRPAACGHRPNHDRFLPAVHRR